MKFIHLSDLHIGKRVNEFSMIEDQKYILKQILQIVDQEQPEAVLIAGDVYDKSVPSAEAVLVFDAFLTQLAQRELQVLVISGNHDSPERLSFGSELMEKSGVHIAPVYDGKARKVSLEDNHGVLDIYLLPFIKPVQMRSICETEEIVSYTDAVQIAIKEMNLNKTHRNVLVTHQFVTGALRSDSEEITVGGSDNVDAAVFVDFDYVALGHIHGPQNIGTERIRYCGTPLKYSFSEADHKKSVTVVELGEKGQLEVRTVPLVSKHDMQEIRGTYMELTAKSYYENLDRENYMHITLTDEADIPNVVGKLRVIYPNLMKIDYDNQRTRTNASVDRIQATESKEPWELFAELYEKQNNQPMSEKQLAFSKELFERVKEERA